MKDSMPARSLRQLTLFLCEAGRIRPVKDHREPGLSVGVWWHDAKQLVGFLEPLRKRETSSRLIDSDLDHCTVWETARKILGRPRTTEYFDVPRGRVLWDGARGFGLVYHGNETTAELVEELARIYRLPRWKSRRDDHYLVGAELEEFFDEFLGPD